MRDVKVASTVQSPHRRGLGLRQAVFVLVGLMALAAAWRLAPQAHTPTQTSSALLGPSVGFSRVEETGKRLYVAICAYCHGVGGDGFGLNAPNLAVPPRDHTNSAYMTSRTDEQLFAVIKYGGAAQGKSTLMPPWGGRLSDREITALVAYLRALTRTPAKHEEPEH